MQDFNQWAQNTKDALENWGAPSKESNFHISDRVIMYSTVTIDPNTSLPAVVKFFDAGAQNSNLSSDTFPLNGKAVTIWGIRVEHCLKLASVNGTENEQQQALEAFSKLAIRYRNRSDVFSAPLSSLVPNVNYLDGNDVTTDVRVSQWLLFKNPLQYGATAPISFELTLPPGFTTEALAASSTPTLPASVGAKYWIKLELLTSQMTQI
ncbi:MAG: hypothetical protein FGM22_07370 [Burkholderiaceae bacterium]|nr:hypothetical protein [Burkholderiaceae bacterium]